MGRVGIGMEFSSALYRCVVAHLLFNIVLYNNIMNDTENRFEVVVNPVHLTKDDILGIRWNEIDIWCLAFGKIGIDWGITDSTGLVYWFQDKEHATLCALRWS